MLAIIRNRTFPSEAILAAMALSLLALPAGLLLGGKALLAIVSLSGLFLTLFIFSVKQSFYFFFIANFFYSPFYLAPTLALHPNDLAFAVLLLSALIHFLVRAPRQNESVPLSGIFAVLLFAGAISLLFAYDVSFAIAPLVRLTCMYALFRIVASNSESFSPKTIIEFYLTSAAALSVIHFGAYLWFGGAERIFGLSGIAFETFTMVGVPMALAFALWDPDKHRRRKFAAVALIIFGGLIATQSRGPAVSITLTITALTFVSHLFARKFNYRFVRKRIRTVAFGGLVAIGVVFFSTNLFGQYLERFTTLFSTDQYSTTTLRISLWGAAIDAFQTSPVTGVGLGNFKTIDEILPHLKFDPVRPWIKRSSAHNVSLQLLAETGILGLSAFLALVGYALRLAYLKFMSCRDPAQIAVCAALFTGAMTIFTTTFFMRVWTWGQEGYLLAIILGLIAHNHRYRISASQR